MKRTNQIFLLKDTQGVWMKNVYEVLRQKELEVSRVEKEVEALRVAAPLLSDHDDSAVTLDGSDPQSSGSQADHVIGRDKARRLP
jgi:hypothetical protein